jgi:hypothetical protein
MLFWGAKISRKIETFEHPPRKALLVVLSAPLLLLTFAQIYAAARTIFTK